MNKTLNSMVIPVLIGVIVALLYLQYNAVNSSQTTSLSYAAAVERSLASVVSITSEEIEEIAASEENAIWNNPVFSGLEDKLTAPQPTRAIPRLGSGVIIDDHGHILTNYHVIKQTKEINVTLADGRSQMAKVIGADPDVDLAVLKLSDTDFPAINIAMQTPRVGDIVLAIGNSFGVGQSVTQGIISGLGRTNLGLANIENFIQTDVAINPGNSGGALINAEGELIGVVTAVFSTDGAYQGISFAIPAYSAIDIAKDLIKTGRVIRGYLGVEMHKLTQMEADFFGIGETNGMLVTGVHPGSPAQRAGIEPGDVLLKIDGKRLQNVEQGRYAVARAKPGSKITISLFRKGLLFDVEATLTNRQSTDL